MRHLVAGALLALTLAGCATNPVTGKKELGMVSEAQEIKIGQEQYGPGRQAQGGDYVTDPKVTEYVRQVGNRLGDRPRGIGVGLPLTQALVERLGGQLEIVSKPGAGTEIDLRVPADVAYRRSRPSALGIRLGLRATS